MGRFDGKVALVTGSTQGVGESTARRLADEGAAGIVVTGRHEGRGNEVVKGLRDLDTDALFVPADLADPDSCQALIAAVDDRFGRIHVLVNAAGLTWRGTIVDTTAKLFDTLMAVNARAPLLLMQGAIAVMRREGIHGAIVNVGSVSSSGSVPTLLPYAASKAALAAMTRNIAYAVAWDRIRVNAIQPGWIATPGEDEVQRRFEGAGDNWLELAATRQPFGRLIDPEELARAIAFLASDDAGLMTGAVVDYDQSIAGAGPQPVPTSEETPR